MPNHSQSNLERSDFELNFGRYVSTLGRADDDDTDTQPD